MPTATLDRAFREDTGLIIMPVRLTGVYFDAATPEGAITFCFRCIMRGGDLKIPPGSIPAGFFDTLPLPDGLSNKYRRQVDTALHHPGGAPVMEQSGGPGTGLSRLLGRRKAAPVPTGWEVMVGIETGAAAGEVEWVVAGSGDPINPVGVPPDPGQPPWVTAVRLIAPHQAGQKPSVRLQRIELAPARPAMTMVFGPSGR